MKEQNNIELNEVLKPNLFEIYENAFLLNQNASSIDYQKYLEQNIMKEIIDHLFKLLFFFFL